jgi:crotonobetainyl-CoA:carnitine CoA-transferase CaiB-like acyl-CoA transferase
MALPLANVRILAVSQFGAGPFGAMMLADLGAEVLKIEDPTTGGDVSRYVPPYTIEQDSLYFQSFNRNNRSITLNLKTQQGQAIFHRLVARSDGVLSNLRGDSWRRLGMDYESLKSINPKIVCCALTAYGTTGPRAAEAGYDYLVQAYAGYMSITGSPDGPPERCGVSIIDHAAGFAAALGLVAGVLRARETGVGCDVDVALLDTAISMLTYLAAWSLNRDYQPQRMEGSAHQTLVPVQTFRTRDSHLVLFCGKERFWQELCALLDAPELAEDPRFSTFKLRYQNREEVLALIQELLLERTTEEWVKLLQGKVPCAPVNTIAQGLNDPQVLARGMIVEVDHPKFGPLREVGSPIKIVGEEHPRAPAAPLGQDTHTILQEELGYSDDDIAQLRAAGAI